MIKVKTLNSVEKIKYVSIIMLTLYFLLYIMGFNFVTMDNTMLDEYEKVNISDYFKGDNISFYKFSSLEKEEFIVGKEVVENGASPPNPDTPLLYVDGYGVLMKACENYWVLFESENRMFEVLSRVIFIRTATTESCHCFNSVVGHSEILEFLQKNEPEPLGELSNDVVHSFFIPGINKYLQSGVYTDNIAGLKGNSGIDLDAEYGPAVIYDTYEQIENEYLEIEYSNSGDN